MAYETVRNTDLVKHAMRYYEEHWGYILNTAGEIWTQAKQDAREADDALVAQAETAQQRRGRQHHPRGRVQCVADHSQEQNEPQQLEAAQAPLQHRTDAGKGHHVECQVYQAAVE